MPPRKRPRALPAPIAKKPRRKHRPRKIVSYDHLREALKDAGFEVTQGGKHAKIHHPEHPGVFVSMPLTPSDSRGSQNIVAEVRARFGIDLKK